jgi:uracil-DNA glycosylase
MTLEQRLKGWVKLPAFNGPEFDKLGTYIATERKTHTVYPERDKIFRAFEVTPVERVKVVLLGQDPYFDGNATGLAFECGVKVSPSMEKIIKIYDQDFPSSFAPDIYDGNLLRWAEQGVLLLNSALTVRKGSPGSHAQAWQGFMKSLLESLSFDQSKKVFIVLGAKARAVMPTTSHLVLSYEHPAAACYENRDWNAKGLFLSANARLKSLGIKEIEW